MPFCFLHLHNTPIFEQLQIEEALLRKDDRNWLIINEGSPKAIVLGISGKTELLINKPKWTQNPVPLIRRFSGGGTVFVDENTLFVTFIGNEPDLQVPCQPQAVMEWTQSLYSEIFPELEFGVRENDYVIGSKKFGGNAQYMCKQRWLHHSSLLWDYHPDNMEYLLMPPKTPHYRERRSHRDFLCSLKQHYPKRSDITHKLATAVHERYGMTSKTVFEALSYKEKPHRQATCRVEALS